MWYVTHPLTCRLLHEAETREEAVKWTEENCRSMIVRVSQSKEGAQ